MTWRHTLLGTLKKHQATAKKESVIIETKTAVLKCCMLNFGISNRLKAPWHLTLVSHCTKTNHSHPSSSCITSSSFLIRECTNHSCMSILMDTSLGPLYVWFYGFWSASLRLINGDWSSLDPILQDNIRLY